MNSKMTTGEIAKKAGVSQKAVRLYDEKGLLKPSDYSEGNYRLYDKEALGVLEKIIALKQVGFSLEDIKEKLTKGEKENILEALQAQVELLEAKRYELEKMVTRINAAILRSNGNPDWDDVAQIIQDIQTDQNKDEGHFHALKHTVGNRDWYEQIYESLGVKEGEHILDLGCGFAKLWRNNWSIIPCNVDVDGYDLRGSWADDFDNYVKEHAEELAEGSGIKVIFEDVEADATWDSVKTKGKYTMAVAHYLLDVIKDEEAFVAHVSEALCEGGMFSVNYCSPNAEMAFWIETVKAAGLKTKDMEEKVEKIRTQDEAFKELLGKYFSEVSEVFLPCPFTYENADELFERLTACYPECTDYLKANEAACKKQFEKLLSKDGKVVIECGGLFRHCYK